MALGRRGRRRPGRHRLVRAGHRPHAGGHRRGRAQRDAVRRVQHGPRPAGLLPVAPAAAAGATTAPSRWRPRTWPRRSTTPSCSSTCRTSTGAGDPLRRLPDRRHQHERRGRRPGLRPAPGQGLGPRPEPAAAPAGRGSSGPGTSARRTTPASSPTPTGGMLAEKFDEIEPDRGPARVVPGRRRRLCRGVVGHLRPVRRLRRRRAAGRRRADRVVPPDHAVALPGGGAGRRPRSGAAGCWSTSSTPARCSTTSG